MGHPVRRLALLLLCIAIPLLPFLAAPTFPSQDGPPHIETAQLLARIRAGEAPVASLFLREHDPGLTNVVAPWALSQFLRVMDPVRAEWLMALALTALLLGAVLLGHRLMRGRPGDLALGVLLCAPLMLYMGSSSLVLGMACGFAALAFAARLLEDGRLSHALLFMLAAVLGCIGNIQVTIPVLGAAFGGVAGAALWRRWRGGRLALTGPELRLLVACLPVVGLALLYKLQMPGGQLTNGADWNPKRQVAMLAFRGDMAWFWYSDLLLPGLLNLVLIGGIVWWLWRGEGARHAGGRTGMAQAGSRWADGPSPAAPWALAAALCLGAAMMVFPMNTYTVPQIPIRIGPFLLFLWFMAAAMPARWRTAVAAIALAAGLSQLVTRSIGHRVLEARLNEMTAMEAQIPSGSVMDVLRLAWIATNPTAPQDTPAHRIGGFRIRFSPFIHPGRGMGGRDIPDLGNYQLMPKWPFFRLHLRPELESVPGIGQLDWNLHQRDIPGGLSGYRARVREASGRDIDYFIVWNSGLDAAERARSDPELAGVLRDLDTGFERVLRSSPAGFAELWRRRGGEAQPR